MNHVPNILSFMFLSISIRKSNIYICNAQDQTCTSQVNFYCNYCNLINFPTLNLLIPKMNYRDQ